MKTKITFNYYWLILVFLIGTTVPLLSYDYFVENLTSIIRKASNIVEADVLDVKQTVDEHNSPIRVVTLKVNEDIVGGTINPTITLKFLVLDYEGINQPLSPKFKVGEKVILHLKKYNDSWIVLGHDQGKFEITGSTIEGSSITASNFKQQIKDVAAMKSNTIDIPLSKKKLFKLKDIEQYEGEGISKLGGEFHVLDPVRYGPTSGNIQFHINPSNAKDKDGNSLSFNDIKAAIQRAVDSWNNVTHSYVSFTVSSSSTSNSRSYGDGVSTITFESDAILQGSNGATWPLPFNGGVINEIDIAFNSSNRWNTNTTYPGSYTLYNHPSHGQIGPVDLEDVAAHELGHGIGLHHVGDSYSTYTLYATIYSGTWWEKTWRRSLEMGDKAGKIYQDPNFPSSITQQNQKILLSARTYNRFVWNLNRAFKLFSSS